MRFYRRFRGIYNLPWQIHGISSVTYFNDKVFVLTIAYAVIQSSGFLHNLTGTCRPSCEKRLKMRTNEHIWAYTAFMLYFQWDFSILFLNVRDCICFFFRIHWTIPAWCKMHKLWIIHHHFILQAVFPNFTPKTNKLFGITLYNSTSSVVVWLPATLADTKTLPCSRLALTAH